MLNLEIKMIVNLLSGSSFTVCIIYIVQVHKSGKGKIKHPKKTYLLVLYSLLHDNSCVSNLTPQNSFQNSTPTLNSPAGALSKSCHVLSVPICPTKSQHYILFKILDKHALSSSLLIIEMNSSVLKDHAYYTICIITHLSWDQHLTICLHFDICSKYLL